MMDLRQFHVLRAIAVSGSLAGAARRLHYGQPTISYHLDALEAHLGARLVERGPTGAVLTDIGAMVLEHAAVVLERVESVESDVAARLAHGVSTLRVGAFTTAATKLLPGPLRRATEGSDVRIELTEAEPLDLLTRLRASSLHCALIYDVAAAKPAHGTAPNPDHSSAATLGHGKDAGLGHGTDTGPDHGSDAGLGHSAAATLGHSTDARPDHSSAARPDHSSAAKLGHGMDAGLGHGSAAGPGHGSAAKVGCGSGAKRGGDSGVEPGHGSGVEPGHGSGVRAGHASDAGLGDDSAAELSGSGVKSREGVGSKIGVGVRGWYGADLRVRTLMDDPYRLLLPRNHALAAGEGAVDLGLLAGEGWIISSGSYDPSDQTLYATCQSLGFRPRIALRADNYSVIHGFVGAGGAVALVPELAFEQGYDVVSRPVLQDVGARGIQFVIPAGPRPAVVDRLWAELHRAYGGGAEKRGVPERDPSL
ncbi:LysR family transcriptional regulator [Nonomuraea endophytica]|uniref:LysR family transcriptional regulator n=1 Tax=Nonomuraea endophytica TaxID=714136 RepID=UPI0037C97181